MTQKNKTKLSIKEHEYKEGGKVSKIKTIFNIVDIPRFKTFVTTKNGIYLFFFNWPHVKLSTDLDSMNFMGESFKINSYYFYLLKML